MKNGEIFPSDVVPAIALEDSKAQPYLFSWGFPGWKGSGVIINARSETVLEKPMFREAFAKRRCIIPGNGFYEWKKDAGKKKKDKYFLHLPDNPLIYMAGFYNVYEKQGIYLPGFVILTTAASPSVQAIHGRMPVIIEKHEQESWLKDQYFALHVIGRKGPQLVTLLIAK
jgi:putative SOS response-associated peptidase YedK